MIDTQNLLDEITKDLKDKMDIELANVDKKCYPELEKFMVNLSKYYMSSVEIMFKGITQSIKEYVDQKAEEAFKDLSGLSLDKCYQHSEVKAARYGAFKEIQEMINN